MMSKYNDIQAHENISASAQIDDTIIVNPSAMVERPGPILKYLGKAFFGAVAFDDVHKKQIKDAHVIGIPVYAINVHSLLDYLYLNYAFLHFGLPLVFFANGVNLLVFRPIAEVLKYIWRRIFGPIKKRLSDTELMRYCIKSGRSCLIFLKKPRTLIQWGGEWSISYLRDLIEIQKEFSKPLIILPTSVIWDQKPEHYRRTIFDIVFGDPQAPGGLRKLLAFILNFRRARVEIGHAIDLSAFLRTNADTQDTEILAGRLKFALHNEFILESKSVRGPVLKGAKVMMDEIMRSPPFQEDIKKLADKDNVHQDVYLSRARLMLKRMAADFRFLWLEGFAVVVSLIFQRLFKGVVVDTEGLREIRESARVAPIIFVPAHRSHIDYLIISLILYTHGLIPPHIAAGDNLSFWPMGPIFRRCGAFFIRRTIKGNPLYGLVLRHYIRKLLKDGFWIEFFIEGTRSRTGKSLPPKYGILSMIVDAVASGAVMDAMLVPTAVTYERVIEERAYKAESAGKEKEKENVQALAKSARVLKSRYGKIYVEFDHPISLTSFLKSEGIIPPLSKDTVIDRTVIRRLAHLLINRINQCLVITPQSLVAFAILTNQRRGMEREELLQRVGFLVSWILDKGGLLTDQMLEPLKALGLNRKVDELPNREDRVEAIGNALSSSIDDVIKMFTQEKLIRVELHGGEKIIIPEEEGRPILDYYKNGMIHFFIPEAILAFAMLRTLAEEKQSLSALSETARDISRLFKFEFIYNVEETYDEAFDKILNRFHLEHLVDIGDGAFSIPEGARETIEWFAGILRPFIDGYRILARTAISDGCPDERKDIVKSAVRIARKMYAVGDVKLPETISTFILTNALDFIQSEIDCGRLKDRREGGMWILRVLGK